EFHDTTLSNMVENAYHAMAIDEHRRDFDVCLWNPQSAPTQTLEQRWFVGAHCDVGGGYKDRRLSDMALRWMQDKAGALGLAQGLATIGEKNYLGAHADSYAQFIGGIYAKKNARHYRVIGASKFGKEIIDGSVEWRRREDREHEPQNKET